MKPPSNCPRQTALESRAEFPEGSVEMQGDIPNDHPGIQNPTVSRVLPSNQGVITYYFVGLGVTGRV